PKPGPLADANGLLDRLDDVDALVADVRGVDPPALRHDLTQIDDVVRLRQRARRHGEHGRESEGAVGERLFEEGLHRRELLLARSRVRLAHRPFPKVVEPDEGGDVDAYSLFLQQREIPPERVPFERLARHLEALGADLPLERPGRPALAEDLRGHALAD